MGTEVKKAKGFMAKILARTDAIGTALGFFSQFTNLTDLQSHVQAIATNPIMPDLGFVAQQTLNNGLTPMMTTVAGGLVIDEVKPPYIGKYGRPLIKLGMGFIGGVAIAEMLKNSHNPGGRGTPIMGSSASTAGRVSYPINGTRATGGVQG